MLFRVIFTFEQQESPNCKNPIAQNACIEVTTKHHSTIQYAVEQIGRGTTLLQCLIGKPISTDAITQNTGYQQPNQRVIKCTDASNHHIGWRNNKISLHCFFLRTHLLLLAPDFLHLFALFSQERSQQLIGQRGAAFWVKQHGVNTSYLSTSLVVRRGDDSPCYRCLWSYFVCNFFLFADKSIERAYVWQLGSHKAGLILSFAQLLGSKRPRPLFFLLMLKVSFCSAV